MLIQLSFKTALFIGLGALCIGVLVGVITKWGRQMVIPADQEAKFSRDCRWSKKPILAGYYFAKCMHPSSVMSQGNVLTSGVYHPDYMSYCSTMRTERFNDKTHCGVEGQFWEAKK